MRSSVVVLLVGAVATAPASAAAADWYVAPNGQDTPANGSSGSPWRTVKYGISRLAPGDTLHVGQGIYQEKGAFDASKSNIKVVGAGDVLIDGSFTEFQTPSQWVLFDAGKGIYRSKGQYQGAGYVGGSFAFQGKEYRLVSYADLSYNYPLSRYEFMTSDNEYLITADSDRMYVGPGIFYDRNGVVDVQPNRFYIRMKKSKYMTGAHSMIPDDPNQSAMFISSWHNNVTIDGCSSVSFENIKLRSYSFELTNAHDITFKNVTFLMDGKRSPSLLVKANVYNLTLDRVTVGAADAPWVAWEDVKVWTGPAYNLEAAAVSLYGGTHDVVIRDSVFNNLWDVVQSTSNTYNLRIFNNVFNGTRDDVVQLGTACYNVDVYGNLSKGGSGVFVSRHGSGSSPQPGTKYIHHNIMDNTEPQRFGRADANGKYYGWHAGDNGDGTGWLSPFGWHDVSATGMDGDPRLIYNNTPVPQQRRGGLWSTWGAVSQQGYSA